jgi:hypothetical protein
MQIDHDSVSVSHNHGSVFDVLGNVLKKIPNLAVVRQLSHD